MNEHRINNILKLNPKDHYRIIIENVFRNDGAWILDSDEDTYCLNINDRTHALVWQDEEIASYYKKAHEISDMELNFIELEEFLSDFLIFCVEENIGLFLNAIPNKEGLIANANHLIDDLNDRIEMEE